MTSGASHYPVQAILNAARRLSEERLNAVQASLKACAELRQDYQRRSRDQAPDHNLIRLLGVERSEVGLHSPLLADLLDPFGTHGQGGIFLRKFFDMLSGHWSDLSSLADTVTEPIPLGEWIIRRERERIDVSIRNQRIGLLIFIENKIDADEQHDQLTRYRALLTQQSSYHRWRLLLYLHPRAKNPPRTGVPDICLTYQDDIASWLRSCANVGPDHIRGNLRQYIDVISNL